VSALPIAQRCWLLACLAAVPLSAIGAAYPPNTWLQVGPVLAGVAFGWWALRRWPMSDASVGWACGFVLLHLFAAHWTYSDVPYDAWSRSLGFGIDAAFGFERNMFDRLVHFLFGSCAMRPLVELGVVRARLSLRMAVAGAILSVLAIGALYEIFEWLLATSMSPTAADKYNGQQGDMFDAQKDMALALLGAILPLAFAGRLFAGINAPPRPDRSR
jgi:putative membrane protein